MLKEDVSMESKKMRLNRGIYFSDSKVRLSERLCLQIFAERAILPELQTFFISQVEHADK